jgi:hypothetical protein
MGSWDIAHQSRGHRAYDPAKTGKTERGDSTSKQIQSSHQEDNYEEGVDERTR